MNSYESLSSGRVRCAKCRAVLPIDGCWVHVDSGDTYCAADAARVNEHAPGSLVRLQTYGENV